VLCLSLWAAPFRCDWRRKSETDFDHDTEQPKERTTRLEYFIDTLSGYPGDLRLGLATFDRHLPGQAAGSRRRPPVCRKAARP